MGGSQSIQVPSTTKFNCEPPDPTPPPKPRSNFFPGNKTLLLARLALATPEDWPYASRRLFSGRLDPVTAGSPGSHSARGRRFSGRRASR
eukprot:4348556-Amphidinium_carterae.1